MWQRFLVALHSVGVRFVGMTCAPREPAEGLVSCDSAFGTTRRNLSSPTFCAMECSYRASDVLPVHIHNHSQLTFVLHGGYSEHRSGMVVSCEAGTALFRPAGDPHANRFSERGALCLNLTIRGNADLPTGSFPMRARRVGPIAALYHLRRELRIRDDVSPLLAEEVGTWLYASLTNGWAFHLDGHPPSWLERIRDRVHSEFDRPPSLAQLATEAGVHRIHVAKAFHHHFGCTVGEYIRLRRLEVACHQLVATDLPVSRIAHNTGFADHSHFARTVRRFLGEAPTSFRQRFAIQMERSLPG